VTISGSPVRPEELKQSQYFDALETIKEEEIDETDANDDVSTFRFRKKARPTTAPTIGLTLKMLRTLAMKKRIVGNEKGFENIRFQRQILRTVLSVASRR